MCEWRLPLFVLDDANRLFHPFVHVYFPLKNVIILQSHLSWPQQLEFLLIVCCLYTKQWIILPLCGIIPLYITLQRCHLSLIYVAFKSLWPNAVPPCELYTNLWSCYRITCCFHTDVALWHGDRGRLLLEHFVLPHLGLAYVLLLR